MTENEKALATSEKFIERWSAHDAAGLRELITDDLTIVLPLNGDGSPEPGYVFAGAEASMGYLSMAMTLFARIRFDDRQWAVTDDTRHVYLHARGDLATTEGVPYRNVYVYRFTLRDGRIAHVDEYTNPVTWAQLNEKVNL